MNLWPPYPPTLPNVLRDAVRRFSDEPFLADGGGPYTFAEADQTSAALALELLALGVGKGGRVGILMPNSSQWVLAYLAAARIGALVVPISTLYQGPELRWVLRHADVQTLLMVDRYLNHDYLERLETVPGMAEQTGPELMLEALPYLRHVVCWGRDSRPWCLRPGGRAQPTAAILAAVEDEVHPADDLMIVYTSGTTLEPKAVVHTHGSAIRLSYALQASGWGDIHRGDRVYSPAPFFWIGGHSSNLFPCMFEGACVVMPPSPTIDDVVDTCRNEQVTTILAAAAHLKAMEERAAARGITLPPVRLRTRQHDSEGKPIPPELLPNMLGMTETFGPHGLEPLGTRLPPEKAGAFGRALAGIDRKIVDPTTGAECPPGEEGELYVRGWSLMRGFYKRLRDDTFDPDGFYPTGDRCRIDADGYLYFAGRYGDMIKTSGANVSPREVEAALERCVGVREAAVIGVPDATRGEAVVAVIVPTDGAHPTEAELVAELRRHLSQFKVPQRVLSLRDEDMPRTDTGKIKKRELREMVLGDADGIR